MRAEATVRLRLNVGAFERQRHTPAYVAHAIAALHGPDERPRRLLLHATIVGTAAASAVGALLFGA